MQKQRKIDELYVNQAVNNMGYIYKQQARQHIITFLAKQTSFRPFDAVRNRNDTIISFIQLRGFIQIAKNNYHEIVIGIHNNFPQGPPIFLLSINRALFRINKEQQMIINKEIILEKDQMGMEFIRFNFPFLATAWKPMTSLIDVYRQFHAIISSPPILIENSVQKHNQWENLHQSNRNANNAQQNNSNQVNYLPGLASLVDSESIELSNIFSTLQQLQSHQQTLVYQQSRNNYLLNYHLKELQTNLKSKSDQLVSKTQQVKKILQKSQQKSTADDFLLISQSNSLKLENMAERQALKQAEKKVKQTLEKQLENGKKYSQYKKIIRSLFTQMYENQSKILQSAQ